MQWLVIHDWTGPRGPSGVQKVPEGKVLDDAVENVSGLMAAGLRAVPYAPSLQAAWTEGRRDPNDALAAAMSDMGQRGPRFMMTLGGGQILGSGTADRYAVPWYDSAQWGTNEVFFPVVPFDMQLDRLHGEWKVVGGVNPVAIDWVVRVDGVDTALQVTTLATAGIAELDDVAITVEEHQRVSFVVRKSAAFGAAISGVTFSMRGTVL